MKPIENARERTRKIVPLPVEVMFTSEKSLFLTVKVLPELGFSALYVLPCTNGAGSVPVEENWMKTPVEGWIETVGVEV